MALCEGLPALLFLTHINTLLTLFKWAKPFQHIQKCFLIFWWLAHFDLDVLCPTLTDELKMKRLFSKCTVYTNASVSLLLAMWYLSSPGSSEPPASTLHCSFLCFETSRLPASSSSSSSCFWVTNVHSKCPCLLSSTNQLLPTNGYLLLTSAASGSSHSFCSHPCSWVE